eukprot:4733881-Ditylum_brightwellii.AAC.1
MQAHMWFHQLFPLGSQAEHRTELTADPSPTSNSTRKLLLQMLLKQLQQQQSLQQQPEGGRTGTKLEEIYCMSASELKNMLKICSLQEDIPIMALLIKMIQQQKWSGEHPVPTATTAAMGLFVFAVGLMTDEDVVDFNINAAAVYTATNTTAADIKVTKLKPTTQLDTAKWLNNMK